MIQNINKKRLVIRLTLVALLVLLCFGLYYIGKEHEVLLDNKTAELAGKEYKEIPYMTVVVDGDEEREMEFYAGDRDVVKLQGARHKIVIKVINEQSEKVEKTVEYDLNLGTVSNIMFSLPAIVDGAPNPELPIPTEQQVQEQQAENEAESEAKKNGLDESPVSETTQEVDSNKTIEGPTTTE